jgi:AbrB family looped-hinge helix DNA binding protein
MGAVAVKVDASGQVVIPQDMREALGIPDGGELLLTVEDGELRATSLGPEAVAELRDLLRPWRRPSGSVVEEFLTERRIEAALEELPSEEAHRARAAIHAARG